MKKILLSSILTLLVSVSLSAKEPFINVMSLSNSSYLDSVKNNINKLGYKTYVSKWGKWHRVYAGPFKNNTEANKALSTIKKHISKDAFLTRIEVATPEKVVKKQVVPIEKKVAIPPVKIQETNKVVKKVAPEKIMPTKQKSTLTSTEEAIPENIVPIEKQSAVSSTEEEIVSKVNVQEKEVALKKDTLLIQESIESKEEKGFYIGLAAGYSVVGVTKNDTSGDVTLNFELQDSGINYGAEMGYYFNNNIFISINYQKTDLEDVSLNNAFTTLNYQFDEMYSFSPYIGAIVGYNTITWEKSPINDIGENTLASSLLGGLQIGSDISLYGGVSLYVFYRYLAIENITNIETGYGVTKIEYSSDQNLNMGIKYHF